MSNQDFPLTGTAPHLSTEEPSVGELFGRLTEQVSRLVRAELDLAKAEMVKKVKGLGIGAGLLVAAAILVFYALGTLIDAAVLGLSTVFAPWLAALVIGFVILAIVAILALVGLRLIKAATPLKPEDTLKNVKDNVDAIKNGVRS